MRLKKKILLEFVEICILFYFLSFEGAVKYFIFFIWVITHILRKDNNINIKHFEIIIPSIVCVIIGSIFTINGYFNFETIKEIIFLVFPSLGAMIVCGYSNKYEMELFIDIIFWVISFLLFFLNIKYFSFENLFESQYAFVFGLYVLYYLYKKNIKFIFAFLFLILSNKRIALGATFIGILMFIIINRNKKNYSKKGIIRKVNIISFFTVIFLIIYIFLCHSNLIVSFLRTNGINSQGRVEIWARISQFYDFNITELGRGLGYISTILKYWNIKSFSRLHNDILVLYIELGFIGFVINIISYFEMIKIYIKKYPVKYNTIVICCTVLIYFFICLCTDNISIYINFLFPFYLILCTCMMDIKDN